MPTDQQIRSFLKQPSDQAIRMFLNGGTVEESDGYLETIGRGAAQGVLGLASGAGSATRWAGDVVGSETLSELGDKASDYFDEKAQEIGPQGEEFTGTFLENPSFKRAVHIISQAGPSLIAGVGASLVGGPIAGAATLGLLEGAPQYEEAREAGKDVGDASGVGAASTIGSAVLEFLPLSKYMKGFKGGIAGRAAKGAVTESGQESSQTFWQNLVAKYGYDETQNLAEGIVESVIAGAGTGAPVGVLTGKVSKEDADKATNDIAKQIVDNEKDIRQGAAIRAFLNPSDEAERMEAAKDEERGQRQVGVRTQPQGEQTWENGTAPTMGKAAESPPVAETPKEVKGTVTEVPRVEAETTEGDTDKGEIPKTPMVEKVPPKTTTPVEERPSLDEYIEDVKSKNLSGIKIKVEQEVDGVIITPKKDVAKLMRDVDNKIDAYSKLLECLA